ncbi:hypothetical protein ACJIZ3_005724 [Penstemon smallii]|uniref:Reverse transcriptase domain-containing protein n=1 Tax=Penstemon smallii TaxID=265156 RepID=A0ABD3S5P8_9LAMI
MFPSFLQRTSKTQLNLNHLPMPQGGKKSSSLFFFSSCNPMRTLAWNWTSWVLKPDILFLSEIKTSSTFHVTRILNIVALHNQTFVPAVNSAGGLCLAWKNSLNIQISELDHYFINAFITIDPNTQPWQFTGIKMPYPLDLENLFPNIMEAEENENLCTIPTPKEFKQVIFSFASEKSPGPDGLLALFYKHFWSTIGTTLIQVVQHFFRTGYMLQALNHTFVTLRVFFLYSLLHKIPNACRVDQFRPISLCNISYKVISKIIANRLKPLLQRFISPNQMAFVEGRTINENSIISHEIIHYLHTRRGKKGFCAIKIDLSKAYDRVEWSLLFCILKHLGICSKFINWIKQCISTCSFSFLINGDPLSPYLFILYTELLSRLLIKEENNGKFKGVIVARTCLTISHILYADDLVIYWKSFTHFSRNVEISFKNDLVSRFNINECDHKTKHLGLTFCKLKSKSKAFNEIISNLQLKLKGWKSKNLSQAGRGILVKSVAQSLPVYPMSTFLLPKTICYTLDKIMRKFWWGSNANGNSLMLKSWSSICLPKSKGGLGLHRTEDFNRALVAKLTWKVASNETKLWPAGIVEEIKVFSDCWPHWHFIVTVRNANSAAHNLVTWAFSLKWTEHFSPSNIPTTVFCDGGYPLVNWLNFSS